MKKPKSKCGMGRVGIEARYYQVRSYRSTTPRTDDSGKRNPEDVLRIAADNLDDVVQYLRRFQAGFDVRSITLIGMMVTVSGMPY